MFSKRKSGESLDALDYAEVDLSLLTIVSFSVERFFIKMLDQIEELGFEGLEFFAMVLLHLKSVTHRYPKEDFRILLNALRNLYPDTNESEFVHSLIFMRKICTQEDNMQDVYQYLELDGNINEINSIMATLSLFSTHLIENAIRVINEIRKNYPVKDYNSNYIKKILAEEFTMVISKTLGEITVSESS